MADELERRIRSSLAARAGDVAPDPHTWETVQQRLRRRDLLRWGLGLTTAAAVAVVLVFTLPRLGGTTGRFPEVADQVTHTPSDPSFSPDGSDLAFVRRPQGVDVGAVVVSGLRRPLEVSVDAGQDPAFGPQGTLAYIDDVPNDGLQPRIVVRTDISEFINGMPAPRPEGDERTFPATFVPDGAEELTARNLTWARAASGCGGRRGMRPSISTPRI